MSKQPFQQLLKGSSAFNSTGNSIMARSTISSQYQSTIEAAETIVMNLNAKTQRQQDTPRAPPTTAGMLATFCKDVDCKTTSEQPIEFARNEKIVALTVELERTKNSLSAMCRVKEENDELLSRCKELQEERTAIYNRILQVEKQMTEDIRRRDDKLEEAYRKIKAMHESNIALQQEIMLLKEQQVDIRLQADKELVDCRSRITILEAESRGKHDQQKNFEQLISQHENISRLALNRLRQELEGKLADQHESHQREMLAKDDILRQLRFEVSKLRAQLTTFSNKDCEYESLLATKESLLREHQNQFEQELQRLHQLFREKETSFENERKSLMANISLVRSHKQRLERELREDESSRLQLEERLRQLTLTNSEVNQRLETLQRSTSTQQTKHQEYELTIEELTKEKNQLSANVEALRSELQMEFKRKYEEAQSQRQEYSASVSELQYQVELERKKTRKLEQEIAVYAEQSASYLKADIENKMLREEVQRLYQSTLDLQEKLRMGEHRGGLCDVTFTNAQLVNEIGERREHSTLRRTQSQKRVYSLDRRRDNYSDKENNYVSNPPSAERTPLAVRQNSVNRLDTYCSTTPTQQAQTTQRMCAEYIDPFICDDGSMLRNKLSEKNLLPQPSRPKPHRGTYPSRNVLYQREKMNESILKRCQMLLQANRLARQ